MKHNLRRYLALMLALALALGASASMLAAFAEQAETGISGETVKTDGGKAVEGGPASPSDASPTDASPTDATATDASPTDAPGKDVPSRAASHENGYTFVIANGQAVIIAADETVSGDVKIPAALGGAPVGVIGMGAFKGNGAVTSVTLPDSVTAVDAQAFAGCSSLERLECGAALRTLPEDAYADCDKLNNNIRLAKNTAYFAAENDGCVFYNRDKTELLFALPGVVGTVTVPETVTYVRSGAFRNCAALEEVAFGNPETQIGPYAFAGCASLKKVTLPAKLREIKEGTFSGCAALDGVAAPDKLTAIGDGAFAGCVSLSRFMIPDNCRTLGDGIFENCAALESVTVYAPLTAVPDGMFAGCAALKEALVPDSVTAVGERAFYGCAMLENVGKVLSYQRFGRDAFTGTAWYEKQVDGLLIAGKTLLFCKGAADKTVDLSGKAVTAIAPGAFENNASLESIILPDSLTEIGASAFAGCAKLKDVTFNGVANIGENAFSGTSFAAVADGQELRLGVNLILAAGKSAPTDAPVKATATDATATDATPTDATATDATATDATQTDATPVVPGTVEVPSTVYTVASGTRSIAGGAFRGRPELTEILLPEGLEILSDGAFDGLSALKPVNKPGSLRYDGSNGSGSNLPCRHGVTVVKYADTAVCVRPHFSGCTYCADCAALLDTGTVLAPAGHRYQKVSDVPDPGSGAAAVVLQCPVCGDTKIISLSEYNTPFTDVAKARADGDYLMIAQGTTAAEVLAGCPAGSLVLTADGSAVSAQAILGSGMTVLFPTSRSYTVVLYGDADGDGQVSPADARFALRRSVGLEQKLDWRDKASHVINDGKTAVTPEDARTILRVVVHLEDSSVFGKAPSSGPKPVASPTDATPTDGTPTDATPGDATPGTDETPSQPGENETPTQPKEDEPADPPKTTYLPGAYVCRWKGGVYLRAYHGYNYSPMDIIPYDATVVVRTVFVDDSGKEPVWWGRITYGGVTGWSALSFFEAK